jgi:hypothetical protein
VTYRRCGGRTGNLRDLQRLAIASNNVPSTSIRPDWQPTDKQLGLQPGDRSVRTAGRESVPGRNEVPW